jgi:hypothetical protein
LRTLLVILLLAGPSFAAKKREPTRAQVHDKAMAAYQSLDFKQAAELFSRELSMLKAEERGMDVELQVRQRLVLSLYQTSRKSDALNEYQVLLEHFPSFRFNEDEVLPETIEFFEKSAKKPKVESDPKTQLGSAARNQPKEIVVSPDSPRVIAEPASAFSEPTAKRWRWYYLTPFGVGQYLAGSPVRGTLFLLLQAGLVAADIGLFVRLNQIATLSGDKLYTNQARATADLQIALNVVFFSMISSFVAGFIDGFFEP